MSLLFMNHESHYDALQLSQRAPEYLAKEAAAQAGLSIPLLSATESAELWLTLEQLLLSCLRTGDDKSAHVCLEKLTRRFGRENPRVMALWGLYQEAIAKDNAALQLILEEYVSVLSADPTNQVRVFSECYGPY
jgi:hypothetical protein